MKPLQPVSEEFFYWDPEAICSYPVREGIEEEWFSKKAKRHKDGSAEQRHIFKRGFRREIH